MSQRMAYAMAQQQVLAMRETVDAPRPSPAVTVLTMLRRLLRKGNADAASGAAMNRAFARQLLMSNIASCLLPTTSSCSGKRC